MFTKSEKKRFAADIFFGLIALVLLSAVMYFFTGVLIGFLLMAIGFVCIYFVVDAAKVWCSAHERDRHWHSGRHYQL